MEIKARIPGTIVAINVKPGDTVKARDNLGTMEAMKKMCIRDSPWTR